MSIPGAIALAVAFATTAAAASPARDVVYPVVPHGADTLRIVVVVDDTAGHRALVRGATIGAEEASHTGVLFGQPVTMTLVDGDGLAGLAAGGSNGRPAPPASIYIVAGDSAFCSRFLRQNAVAMVPVLDAGCPRTDTIAGAAYALDSRPAGDAKDSTHPELWHSSLERFGAEQLNQRFRRRFNAAMDSDAWAGWFAMKVALDLALHAHGASPSALRAQLADPHASFDGQKGRPLRFAPETHRLVQPLYRVTGTGDSARVVAEVAP